MDILCPNLTLTLPALAVGPSVKGKSPVLRELKLTSVHCAPRFLKNSGPNCMKTLQKDLLIAIVPAHKMKTM